MSSQIDHPADQSNGQPVGADERADTSSTPLPKGLPSSMGEQFEAHVSALKKLDAAIESTKNAAKNRDELARSERAALFDLCLAGMDHQKAILAACAEEGIAVVKTDSKFRPLIALRFRGKHTEISRRDDLLRYAYEKGIGSGVELLKVLEEDYGNSINKMLAAADAEKPKDYDFEAEVEKRRKATSKNLFDNEDFTIDATAENLPTGRIMFFADHSADGKVRIVDYDFGNEPFTSAMRRRVEAGLSKDLLADFISGAAELAHRAAGGKNEEQDTIRVSVSRSETGIEAYVFDPNRASVVGAVACNASVDTLKELDKSPRFLTGPQIRGLADVITKFDGFAPVITSSAIQLVLSEDVKESFEDLRKAYDAGKRHKFVFKGKLEADKVGRTISATAGPDSARPDHSFAETHPTAVWFNESLAKMFSRDVQKVKDAKTGALVLTSDSLTLRVNAETKYRLELVTAPITDLQGVKDQTYFFADIKFVARLLQRCRGGRIWFGDKGMRVATRRGDLSFDITVPRATGQEYDREMVEITTGAAEAPSETAA